MDAEIVLVISGRITVSSFWSAIGVLDLGLPLLVTAMLLEDSEGRVLMAERTHPPELSGKWELPGGKLDPDESPEACLAREAMEELGLEIEVGRIFDVCYHNYPKGEVLILCFRCKLVAGEPKGLEGQKSKWVKPSDITSLDLVPADVTIINHYLKDLGL